MVSTSQLAAPYHRRRTGHCNGLGADASDQRESVDQCRPGIRPFIVVAGRPDRPCYCHCRLRRNHRDPALLYPLAFLTASDVLVILTLIFTIVWVMIAKKDNQFNSWKELSWWLLAGFGTALALIAVMDFVRFSLTGTWDGFVL